MVFIMQYIHYRGLTFLANAHIRISCFILQMISKCVPCRKYRTALEVVEGILQCLKEFDPLPTSIVEVDNQWNVTFKSQDEWVAITVPVAQPLGWLTREKTITPGVQMSGSFTTSHKHGHIWCVILPQTTVSFPGNFTQPPVIVCLALHQETGN